MQKLIENHPELAEEIDEDNNNITFILKITYGLRIYKYLQILLFISYFVGLIFFIFSDLSLEIAHYIYGHGVGLEGEDFLEKFSIYERSNFH